MERKLLRRKAGRFCQIEVKLTDGRLSVCGTEGRIVLRARAKKMALEYWRSFFEDQPEEIMDMNKLCGTRFTSASGAAKYVLAQDGEFHGLDVHDETEDEVFITESCGQIRDELRAWFPELAELMVWHLNDMNAECEHQRARGETWQTHPEAVCSDCGYKLGSKWLRRELPTEIVKLAEGVQ